MSIESSPGWGGTKFSLSYHPEGNFIWRQRVANYEKYCEISLLTNWSGIGQFVIGQVSEIHDTVFQISCLPQNPQKFSFGGT